VKYIETRTRGDWVRDSTPTWGDAEAKAQNRADIWGKSTRVVEVSEKVVKKCKPEGLQRL
jgi:hypothetical protein